MPRYFKSTANKPGGGVRKGYRRGGRNLRDEEARVIGVQDNAADELRRVRARRPHDAAERRDKRSQLSRVGSRERNARDEMHRLRGYQYGGAIGRQAAAMGPAINRRIAAAGAGPNSPLRYTAPAINYMGGFSPRTPRGNRYQYGGEIVPDMSAVDRQLAALETEMAQLQQNPTPAMQRAKQAYDFEQTPEGQAFLAQMQGYHNRPRGAQYGGRVGFKKGGRIPSKKGAKFI